MCNMSCGQAQTLKNIGGFTNNRNSSVTTYPAMRSVSSLKVSEPRIKKSKCVVSKEPHPIEIAILDDQFFDRGIIDLGGFDNGVVRIHTDHQPLHRLQAARRPGKGCHRASAASNGDKLIAAYWYTPGYRIALKQTHHGICNVLLAEIGNADVHLNRLTLGRETRRQAHISRIKGEIRTAQNLQ